MRILSIAALATAAFVLPAAAVPAAAGTGQSHVSVSVRAGQHHRGHHYGRRAHWRTVCTTHWRHHHRYRTCRKVRYWR